MKILVTGVGGFIFSNFIKVVSERYPNYQWIGVDKLVKDHNVNNLSSHSNYKFYLADIADAHTMNRIFEIEKPDIVINGAAESFVDNSITDVLPFLHTNILGTQTVINCCLKYNCRLLHISTDEVYGQKLSMNEEPWTEEEPLSPRNPYAASKACAEMVVTSAHETHGLKYQMTRSCNVYGPSQKHDNLIPHIINSLIEDKPIHIHGTGTNFRQYIYVEDKINAIMRILERGKINEVYNIGASNYCTNLDMVKSIGYIMMKKPVIEFIPDRKAHDFGYLVDNTKLKLLGWQSRQEFYQGLSKTAQFYMRQHESNIIYNK